MWVLAGTRRKESRVGYCVKERVIEWEAKRPDLQMRERLMKVEEAIGSNDSHSLALNRFCACTGANARHEGLARSEAQVAGSQRGRPHCGTQ